MTDNFNLCLNVLKKLHTAKVLDKVTIIGSWALFFYQQCFKDSNFIPVLRTKDIDFLVPLPLPKWEEKIDLPHILEELGFSIIHNYSSGLIRLSHPELIVEFLVPEQGRGSDKPLSLPELKMNAQRIRYLNYLLEDTLQTKYERLPIHLPQPARYAFHKLIVASLRKNKEKSVRDTEQAMMVFSHLFKNNGLKEIKAAFGKLPKKWEKTIYNKLVSIKSTYPELTSQLFHFWDN